MRHNLFPPADPKRDDVRTKKLTWMREELGPDHVDINDPDIVRGSGCGPILSPAQLRNSIEAQRLSTATTIEVEKSQQKKQQQKVSGNSNIQDSTITAATSIGVTDRSNVNYTNSRTSVNEGNNNEVNV